MPTSRARALDRCWRRADFPAIQGRRLVFAAKAHGKTERIDILPNGSLQYRPGFDGLPLAGLAESATGERSVVVPLPAPTLPFALSVLAENAKAHRTLGYEQVAGGPTPVRRGQALLVEVALPAEMAPQPEDFADLLVDFNHPGPKLTLFGLGVAPIGAPALGKLADGRPALVQRGSIALPGDTAVGSWALRVRHYDSPFLAGESSCTANLLFNPYRPNLPESLPETASPEDVYGVLDVRTEPMTAPTAEGATLLWDGTPGAAAVWTTTLAAVDALPLDQRREPLPLAKALAELVRKGGIVRWASDADGKQPWQWTGSTEIFGKKGGQPVKYGQCWVFSGVLASMSRSIGIPTRPMTNLDSAHSRQQAIAEGTALAQPGPNACRTTAVDAKGNPAVWNFHLWNEVYQRPGQWRNMIGTIDDSTPLPIHSWGQVLEKQAPPGSSAWSTIDATPQESGEVGGSEPIFDFHISLGDKWQAVAPWVEAIDLGFAALDSKSEPAQALAASWTQSADTIRYWLFEGCYKYEAYQSAACVANARRSFERQGRLTMLSGLVKK